MKTTFNVHHLDCASCKLVMEGICEDTPGVQKAEVLTGPKHLVVEHDETVDITKLKAALDAEGYPVEVAN